MSRPKKRTSPVQQQKLASAQSYNNFVEHLQAFLDKSVGPAVFRLLPPAELDRLYLTRCHSIRVAAAPGQHIPDIVLKSAKRLAKVMFTHTLLDFGIGQLDKISFRDFFSIVFTIAAYESSLKEDSYPHAAQVKTALAPFVAFGDSPNYVKGWEQYNRIMELLGIMHSCIGDRLYVAKNETKVYMTKNSGTGFSMELYSLTTPATTITIDGKNRPVYPVALAIPQPEPRLLLACIAPAQLLLPVTGPPLEFYIQSHALDRLSERMDTIGTGVLHRSLYDSCMQPELCKNHQGVWLLTFRLLGAKTGYLLADIIDGKVVLRTFLFLTNNGTPEGEKLYRHTGLKKEDKAYLSIDKLSTFITSDISRAPRLKQLFIDAGCESLFHVDRNLSHNARMNPEQQIAGFITHYLQLDSDNNSGPVSTG